MISSGQDVLILSLRHCLSDGEHVVTNAAQVLQYRRTGGLIYDELHGGCHLRGNGEGENILMGQHLGRVGQGSADVSGLQTGVLLQDVTPRDALSQHAHNQLHRDAGSSDHRLADHDSGVHADTLPKLFVHEPHYAPQRVQDL